MEKLITIPKLLSWPGLFKGEDINSPSLWERIGEWAYLSNTIFFVEIKFHDFNW